MCLLHVIFYHLGNILRNLNFRSSKNINPNTSWFLQKPNPKFLTEWHRWGFLLLYCVHCQFLINVNVKSVFCPSHWSSSKLLCIWIPKLWQMLWCCCLTNVSLHRLSVMTLSVNSGTSWSRVQNWSTQQTMLGILLCMLPANTTALSLWQSYWNTRQVGVTLISDRYMLLCSRYVLMEYQVVMC